jgi:hypothetical protein
MLAAGRKSMNTNSPSVPAAVTGTPGSVKDIQKEKKRYEILFFIIMCYSSVYD